MFILLIIKFGLNNCPKSIYTIVYKGCDANYGSKPP